MNVLLIGSGGREHALAYSISKSTSLSKLYITPGNPGTEKLGENVYLDQNSGNISEFCLINKIELVVIGPENPLVNGLANKLRANGINVFGPDAKAADIEAHKSFAKKLMKDYNIPTASFAEFNSEEFEEAVSYIKKNKYPLVIKADGLAAGKGVIICYDFEDALSALEEIFIAKVFGSSGDKIIIEEFMEGEEASIFVVTDGDEYVVLPSAQDHKRIGNKDTGKNTGGMGAYSPAPLITPWLSDEIEKKIIIPTLNAMKKENRRFSGCLYCGIMITNGAPKVVEYNCRFGDPETQAVLPLLDGDFLKLLYSAAIGNLDKNAVRYNGRSSLCIVLASGGYPDKYKSGFEIKGLDACESDILVFHAGTKKESDKIVTSAGRVLGVTAVSNKNDLREAKEKVYRAVEKIRFENMYFRNDIGEKAFKYLQS